MSSPVQRHGIFLCYRREDSEDFASRLYDELAEKFGYPRVFKDVDSLLPGFDWEDHLRERLAEAAIVIVLIGPDWSDCVDVAGRRRLETPDDHVRTEIESALAERIPVIPLLIGQTQLPDRTTLPETIRALVRRQSFAIRRDQHFRPDVRLFIDNLDRVFEALTAKAPAAAAADPVTAAVVTPAAAPVPPAKPAPAPAAAVPAIVPLPIPPTPAAAAPESRQEAPRDSAEPSRKLGRFAWCGLWYLASLLLPVPALGAWWQARLLRQRAPSVHAWWPILSVAPAIAFFIYFFAHELGGEYYYSDIRCLLLGWIVLAFFLPQWALLQAARVRWAWLWMVLPAVCYILAAISVKGHITVSDMVMVPILTWILQGLMMGPLLYWQTRSQATGGAAKS